MRRAVLLIICLLLAGCATNGPIFTEAPPPPDGKVLVYFYRDQTMAGGLRNAAFAIDGKKFADLLPTDYTYIYLTPGRHQLKQHWPYWPGDTMLVFQKIDMSIDIKPGRTYYFRFWTNVQSSGSSLDFEWFLKEVPEKWARTDLPSKHFQPADPAVASTF